MDLTIDEQYSTLMHDAITVMLRIVYPVFPYNPSFPLAHGIVRDLLQHEFGDGYYQTISQEMPTSRADGNASIATYYGRNIFTLQFPVAVKGDDELAYNLWEFLRARLDNNNEPFYFYNPTEKEEPDLTGTNTTGRYLVRIANPSTVLDRTYYAYKHFRYAAIVFIETKDVKGTYAAAISATIDDNYGSLLDDDINDQKVRSTVNDIYNWAAREKVTLSLG